MHPVISSDIKAIGYNPKKSLLVIDFKNNRRYSYTPITQEIFNNLMASESKGQYFNQHIKNKEGIHYEQLD